MLADILDFTASSMAAWGAEKPRERPRLRRGEEPAPGGPLWTAKVPRAKLIVPFIIAFARDNQTFRISANDIHVMDIRIPNQPTVVADGMIAHYHRSFLNGKLEDAKQEVAFDSLHEDVKDQVKSLARADDWTTFGHIQTVFSKGCLKPDVHYVNGTAELVWPNAPRARWAHHGLFGWAQHLSETALVKFVIRPDGGEIVTDGPMKNYVLPDLVWA